jgi:hypothetical protein
MLALKDAEIAKLTRERNAARSELAHLLNVNRNVSGKCNGEWETCYCETCAARRAADAARERFFTFVKQCGQLLGLDDEQTAKLLNDSSWFFCFDDGMTPEQSVEAFKARR